MLPGEGTPTLHPGTHLSVCLWQQLHLPSMSYSQFSPHPLGWKYSSPLIRTGPLLLNPRRACKSAGFKSSGPWNNQGAF